jgi:hypothetical protein
MTNETKTKNEIEIPIGSAVVFNRSLRDFNPSASRCEICFAAMADHAWVIMDEHGFVIIGCSFKMEPTSE